MRRLFLSFILLLPSAAFAASSPATVRVKPGQTLYSLARAHGLSVAQLQRLNGLKGTTIEVGQVLRVAVPKAPVKPTAKPSPAPKEAASPKTVSKSARTIPAKPATTYRVQRGDTLAKIGVKVGLRVEQLKRLNGLKSDALQIGQTLRLTAPPVPKTASKVTALRPAKPPTTYTVRRGDTLTSIGKFVGLRVEQLQRLNGLQGTTLKVGQVLRLTAPQKVAPPARVAVPARPASGSSAPPTTYRVQPGDTLAKIGVKVGLRVEQLQRLNGLSGTTIQVGQVLKLRGAPTVAKIKAARVTQPQTYVVRSGDTLGVIATRFGVSVDALQAANGLGGTVIQVGQRLRVPVKAGVQTTAPTKRAPLPSGTEARLVYRYVRVGLRDNANSLAQTYRITPEQLRRLNGLGSARHIVPGMRLLVPQSVAVPVPPRPVAAPVTLRRTTVMGIEVQVVKVDLRWRNVLVTPVLPQTGLNFGGGATVSTLAARSGARALVNGSYFHPGTYAPAGDIVMQGRLLTWGRIPAALAITPDNRAQIRQGTTGFLGRVLDSSWAGMETVIATGPQIVRDGVVQTRYSSVFRDPAVFGQAARSAIGLGGPRDLLLVTTHAKLSTVQMGQVMQSLGARDALLLDGGSSAGLAWNGAAVLNSVRKVSYGIGVFTGYTGKRYAR